MRRVFLKSALCFSFLLTGSFAAAQTVTVLPGSVVQGEPLMVRITDIASLSDIKKITFDGRTVSPFLYQSTPTAFVGIDLNEKVGTHILTVTLMDGTVVRKDVIVNRRENVQTPVGIPDKLGGNTKTSQKNLVSALTRENNLLASLPSNPKMLWTEKFIFPVLDPVVSDPYGYERLTGEYTIAHKGTDFRAKGGTNVYAMNRGVVRVAKTSSVYGKMIVVDHGKGLMTFYMHLSTINAVQGTLVQQGDIIGRSGQTGYALAPHLHITVRVNNISIDPMKFLAFFQEQ